MQIGVTAEECFDKWTQICNNYHHNQSLVNDSIFNQAKQVLTKNGYNWAGLDYWLTTQSKSKINKIYSELCQIKYK